MSGTRAESGFFLEERDFQRKPDPSILTLSTFPSQGMPTGEDPDSQSPGHRVGAGAERDLGENSPEWRPCL